MFQGGGSFIVDSLLIVITDVGFCNCSIFCALLYIYSSYAFILMGKRELVALFSWSSWCLVIFVWLFPPGAMGLSAVFVVFPDHAQKLFSVAEQLMSIYRSIILQSVLAAIVYMSFSKFMD